MEKYSEYKDSGVQLLGEIPSHWHMIQNRFLMMENVRTPQIDDIPLSLSQVDGLIPTDEMKESSLKTSSYDNWKRVLVDDIVLNRFKAHLGVLFASKYIGMVSFHYGVYERKRELVPKYYEYLFHSDQYRLILGFASKGMTVGLQNLGNSDFYNIKSTYPPLSEQQAIVSYLDDKCGKIDQLLENKAKELELLTEMKHRVISDSVTKGLNPDVTMKDSGIMWIPEIPGHWSSNRVKHLFTHHKIIAKEKSTEYERLALTMAGVIKRDKEDGTGLQPDNFDTYQVVFDNDIIFKLIDLNNISTSRVGLSPYTGIVSPAYIVISPKEGVYTKFFEYYFKDMWHRCIFNALGDNGVRSSLSTTDVLSLPIPVPPIDEQEEIVAHIEEKVSKIDALAEKLQKEIENIKEYKQRLISDVVTGQIKVC